MIIQKCSFDEIEAEPNFAALLVEYAAESAIDGMPKPKIEPETYRRLEAAGVLHIFAAKVGGRLIGFVFVIVAVLPHYSVLVANTESIFVAKAKRMSGAGVKLLRVAEDKARELGAHGPLVSVPAGGDLSGALQRMGYVETNRVFFKKTEPARDLVVTAIPAMAPAAIERVRALESEAIQRPQVDIATDHVIHGGVYYRTMFIPFVPPGELLITGALVKIPTTLIIDGDVTVYIGSAVRWTGRNVVPAMAGRKQAFVAHADTYVTMCFPTQARSIDEAEREFTDEADLLASRRCDLNSVLITGE